MQRSAAMEALSPVALCTKCHSAIAMLRAMGEQDAVRGGFGHRLPTGDICSCSAQWNQSIGCAQQQYGRMLTAT